VAGTALGELLLTSAPLYQHYAGVTDRSFGLTYAGDQSTAAILMMAEQVGTLGVAAAVLFWRHVESLERRLAT